MLNPLELAGDEIVVQRGIRELGEKKDITRFRMTAGIIIRGGVEMDASRSEPAFTERAGRHLDRIVRGPTRAWQAAVIT